jgi:hypothetical protein
LRNIAEGACACKVTASEFGKARQAARGKNPPSAFYDNVAGRLTVQFQGEQVAGYWIKAIS